MNVVILLFINMLLLICITLFKCNILFELNIIKIFFYHSLLTNNLSVIVIIKGFKSDGGIEGKKISCF